MLRTFNILLLVLLATSLYSQWEVKNLNADVFNTIYKLKFHNDSVGYAMGTQGLILRTEDQGESWQEIETEIEGDILDFDFNSAGDIILIKRFEKGTYKSINGFDFFEIFPSPGNYSNIEYAPSNKFYLSKDEIIYRSSNDGEDWAVVHNMEDNGYQWAYITDFSFVNNDLYFAVGRGDPFGSAGKSSFVLRSIDAGDKWEIIHENESFDDFSKVHFEDEMIGYVLTINETLKTINGGDTWEILPNEYGAVDIATPKMDKVISVNRPAGYNGAATSTIFTISESNDAGLSWSGEFQDGAHLESIYFLNDSVGFVAGDYSLILKTEKCGGEIGEDYPWYLFDPNSTVEKNQLIDKLFPNPAFDKLYIERDSKTELEFIIRTINGEILKQDYISSNNVIDVNDLNPGMYLITLLENESLATFKFLKVEN